MSAAPILTISRDGETIRSFPVESESILGRGEGCVIRLDDRAISRQHAVFRPIAGGVQVEKKSEFAPISVNGTECTTAIVKDGDVIAIGPYLLRLSRPGSAPAGKAVPLTEANAAVALSPLTLSSVPLPSVSQSASPVSLSASSALEVDGSAQGGATAGEGASPQGDYQINLESPAGADGQTVESSAPGSVLPIDSSMPPEAAFAQAMEPGYQPTRVEMVAEDAPTRILAPEKFAVKLVFEAGAANVAEFEFTPEIEEISIGRGKNCDIVLNDKKASRKNAVIRREGASYVLKDLSSANGTWVNGARVSEQVLSGDDRIRIGNVEFVFQATSADYFAREKNFMPVPAVEDEVPNGIGIASASDPFAAMQSAVSASPLPTDDAAGNENALGGIAGIAGIGQTPGKKPTLLEKYRALPKRRQAIVTFCLIALAYLFLFDDDSAKQAKKAPAKPAGVTATSGAATTLTFDSLTPEQKKFVETQHDLAFDYFSHKDYDKAIEEINRIFPIIPDYKDSREIKRYAEEGQRSMRAMAEENRKKEEEARLKARIAELVEETRDLMKRKEYEQARELFTQILALDPDNAVVADWRKELDQYEEERRLAAQQKAVQQEINGRAAEIYRQAASLKKQGKFYPAIAAFTQIKDMGTTDRRLMKKVAWQIQDCRARVKSLRDPILSEAHDKEQGGELPAAFKLYLKATQIDPYHPGGFAGMNRIKGVLHERARTVYTEGVLAESYSDFATAKKKFNECLDIAPGDDLYHDRAQRKLARYFEHNDTQAVQ